MPLDLPSPRGGLPLPLELAYGGHDVGAAGLGWDLPLSYVQQRRTFAHRRPAYGQYALPVPRQRTFLSLLGQDAELLQEGSGWVARTGTLELQVRQTSGGWTAWDGQGRTYTFVQAPQFASAGLWLLKSIEAPGGVRLTLEYQLNTWPITGGSAVAIDLARIAYDTHPATGCAKHELTLAYGAPAPKPLTLSMLGEQALVRFHTLTSIDVLARETCNTSPQRLQRYVFTYAPDADTTLPRLMSVRRFGRQGTAEETQSLPVATYTYGTATRNGKLRYAVSQLIALPAEGDHREISGSQLDSSVVAPGGERYATWQSLTDVTGDGRPDLVLRKNNVLSVALNHPAAGGKTTLGVGQGVLPLHDAVFSAGAFSTHSTTTRRFVAPTGNNDLATVIDPVTGTFAFVAAHHNVVDSWREAIDVNGDGRIDIVDAAQEPLRWVVYLNTPGGQTSGVKWVRRTFSVANLALELISRGHELPGNRVPLSRRSTSGDVKISTCWRWVPSEHRWVWFNAGWGEQCFGTPGHVLERGPERTFVEWQLTDMNGDGYPDVVFDSTPVRFQFDRPMDEPTGGAPTRRYGDVWVRFAPGAGNALRVAYNDVGVRAAANEPNPFARSVTLQAPSPELSVSLWEASVQGAENVQRQVAGLADVNGDGLTDRVLVRRAYLGVYIGTARAFSPVYLELPDVLSEQRSNHDDRCDTEPRFTSRITRGLRDLTGDGVPDYVGGGVHIGTGAGFAPPVGVDSQTTFVFSHQTESCDGEDSKTDGGLYDIDGDGQPEIIGLVSDGMTASYAVSQLAAGTGPRTPEAGRLLTQEDAGGARTRIAYVSAKEDLHSPHQVPFAEIVVAATQTEGTKQLGGELAGARYAYGYAEMRFDPARDGFSFAGYQRAVEVRPYGIERAEGFATVTDRWPLTPFTTALTPRERWLRTQRVGRLRDLYTLRGSGTVDPWSLLGIDANDTRVIGVLHQEWDARLFAPTPGTSAKRDCFEMVLPYNFPASSVANAIDTCTAHGFVFATSTDAWRGASQPPSASNVQTHQQTRQVDDFGRATLTEHRGDLFRSDDDACVATRYAQPVAASGPRVLTAVASVRVTDCAKRLTYARQAWTYDGLGAGFVSAGRVSSHAVERRATDNGALLRTIRRFDATYDAAGNVASVTTQRGGATRTVHFTYDAFGLAPTRVRTSATGVPAGESTLELDPLSLDPRVVTDENGTKRGVEHDGFGREVRTTFAAPGEPAGVLSTTGYVGFDGSDPAGRRIVSQTFPMPVPPAQVASAQARTSTTFLDELGRQRQVAVALGSDYGDQSLVLGARRYDALGRLAFEADAYPSSADANTAYGTSYHYKRDGEPACFVRGRGPQPLTNVPDVAAERFPTCFQRLYDNHLDILEVRDAASLTPGMPQTGVVLRTVSSAIGRPIERSTVKAGVRLDHATFTQDRLGQTTSLTRYRDPVNVAGPVRWAWRKDSLGQTLRAQEPLTADRTYDYSDWGEMVEARWLDNGIERAIVSRFDALGRPVQTHERTGGTIDAETVATYDYDVAAASAHATPTYVAGRLARARTPGGGVAFGYDAFGQVNLRVFSDDDGTEYVEQRTQLADGALAALEFRLPDNGYAPELLKYSQDSAGRVREIRAADAASNRVLYRAEDVDVWGRERKARHGETVLSADHADTGRRLLQQTIAESASGSRQLLFLGYDAVGREQVRREIPDGSSSGPKTNVAYDAMGRLVRAVRSSGPTILGDRAITYDALGNVLELSDNVGTHDATLSYDPTDPDRLCRVGYGNGGLGGTSCNVTHDAMGNVTRAPTRTGMRELDWYASGLVRAIDEQGAQARFRYDPFGEVQEVAVTGAATDNRRDRRHGALLELRETTSGSTTTSTLRRRIPGPGGIVATRHGPRDDWTFDFGEARGNRFFTDAQGHFVQDVAYEPFGEAASSGALPGAPTYSSQQWNEGDALASFGVSQLGARVYDPVIGRFLGRDPLRILRGAASTNPYAFARNDPLNDADPTGLDDGLEQPEPLTPLSPFDLGGGSGDNSWCGGGPCSRPPPPPDPWNMTPTTPSGSVVISPDVATKVLVLKGSVALGNMTAAGASRAFQDYLRTQIHTYQRSENGAGFCACATRQIALKYTGIIRPGMSYPKIKVGLAEELSPNAKNRGDWEYWHFNETRINGKIDFSNPQKLGPDAISRIAANPQVGTGSTERLRWREMTPAEARIFMDEGGIVAVMTAGGSNSHWLTMLRDPFVNRFIYIDPYYNTRDAKVMTSTSMDKPPNWDGILQYHGLVHE